jgi:hypothetical protein
MGKVLIAFHFQPNHDVNQHKVFYFFYYRQRKLQRQDKLPQDRLDLLDAIGFVWMPHTDTWNDTYNELVQYYAEVSLCMGI